MNLNTALDLMEGHHIAANDAQRRASATIVLDPGAMLALLAQHELELRINDRWECGWFAYDDGEDVVHGRGATPAEAIAAAAASLREPL
jgi:hypothetical protein